MTEPLILASASAARAAMLRAAGVTVTADPADIDETAIKNKLQTTETPPAGIATALAAEKALHVSQRHQGRLILGADQILVHQGTLMSKAPDLSAARAQLHRLSGGTHQLISAAALVRDGTVLWQETGLATLTMRTFTDAFLDRYLAEAGDLVLGSVGCYHLEGLGAQLFDRVDGDYFTVLGLPLLAVLGRLRAEGVLDQ